MNKTIVLCIMLKYLANDANCSYLRLIYLVINVIVTMETDFVTHLTNV